MTADFARGHNLTEIVFVECMTSFRTEGEALRPIGETEFVVANTPATQEVTDTRLAAGIVGWADLMRPKDAARTMDGHIEAGQGRFRGIRSSTWYGTIPIAPPPMRGV